MPHTCRASQSIHWWRALPRSRGRDERGPAGVNRSVATRRAADMAFASATLHRIGSRATAPKRESQFAEPLIHRWLPYRISSERAGRNPLSRHETAVQRFDAAR